MENASDVRDLEVLDNYRKAQAAVGRMAYRKIYLKGAPPAVDLLNGKTTNLRIKKKTVKTRCDYPGYARTRVVTLSDNSHSAIYETAAEGKDTSYSA